MKQKCCDFLNQSVKRKDMLIAFILTTMFFGGTLAYTMKVQSIVTNNQCDALNRLAETKLIIYIDKEFENDRGDKTEPQLTFIKLEAGIRALTEDAQRIKGCKIFPVLVTFLDGKAQSVR